jgi:hypothetical protein
MRSGVSASINTERCDTWAPMVRRRGGVARSWHPVVTYLAGKHPPGWRHPAWVTLRARYNAGAPCKRSLAETSRRNGTGALTPWSSALPSDWHAKLTRLEKHSRLTAIRVGHKDEAMGLLHASKADSESRVCPPYTLVHKSPPAEKNGCLRAYPPTKQCSFEAVAQGLVPASQVPSAPRVRCLHSPPPL